MNCTFVVILLARVLFKKLSVFGKQNDLFCTMSKWLFSMQMWIVFPHCWASKKPCIWHHMISFVLFTIKRSPLLNIHRSTLAFNDNSGLRRIWILCTIHMDYFYDAFFVLFYQNLILFIFCFVNGLLYSFFLFILSIDYFNGYNTKICSKEIHFIQQGCIQLNS